MRPDVAASLVVAAMVCALVVTASGWAVGRRAWPVVAGLAVVLVGGSAAVAAAQQWVPGGLVVPLVALAPLQPAGLVLVLGRPDRSLTTGAVVGLAGASSVSVALGHATFSDPRCAARCDAAAHAPLGDLLVDGVVGSALMAAAAVLVLSQSARSRAPAPVRGAVGLAALWIVGLAVVRGSTWGAGPRLAQSLGWLLLPAGIAASGVLVSAVQATAARRQLASAARRLEVLALAPGASSVPAGTPPVVVEGDGGAGSLVDEILMDNVRTAASIASRRAELRASQSRVVMHTDRERVRIERDLHDGVQQRLVAASFCLALADGRATPDERTVLRAAIGEVQTTLEGLRAVGQKAFPRLLETDGLVAALQGLAAVAPLPVRLEAADVRDLPRAAGMSAYAVVRDLAVPEAQSVVVEVEVAAERADCLSLRVGSALSADRSRAILDLGTCDRVGAVGGTVRVRAVDEGSVVEVVIPCGS
jgi:signal transduction histidine kinase